MNTITLPGLIDIHTHMRVPGGEHKEDFATGTAAALAGGVTMLLAMPNTTPPLTTPAVMQQTRETAAATVHCDVGLFAGASPEQISYLPALAPHSVALKIYLNDTFGPLRVEDLPTLRACFQNWPQEKMIAMHAEKQSVAVGIGLAAAYGRPVHFCHISRRQEIELIADAKSRGLPVTCEVTPHHLFLTTKDAARLGPLGDMRPLLGSQDDVNALWSHIDSTIDLNWTDHAPHTLTEKHYEIPPPGVPGLQTSLPLMLTAVAHNRLTLDRLIELMHHNPRRIFNLPHQENTHVEIDMTPTTIRSDQSLSKVRWTPFDGAKVTGQVIRVTLHGQPVYENGRILTTPGTGQFFP